MRPGRRRGCHRAVEAYSIEGKEGGGAKMDWGSQACLRARRSGLLRGPKPAFAHGSAALFRVPSLPSCTAQWPTLGTQACFRARLSGPQGKTREEGEEEGKRETGGRAPNMAPYLSLALKKYIYLNYMKEELGRDLDDKSKPCIIEKFDNDTLVKICDAHEAFVKKIKDKLRQVKKTKGNSRKVKTIKGK